MLSFEQENIGLLRVTPALNLSQGLFSEQCHFPRVA